MSEFTASNGQVIWRSETPFSGGTHVSLGFGAPVAPGRNRTFVMSNQEEEALREFFRAEEDERLGRWRWPENPDYVVYPPKGGIIRILRESDGETCSASRESSSSVEPFRSYYRIARAYFDAHPEPKPWHDAKHGEIWVLFVAIKDEPYRVNGDVFEPVSNPGRIRIPLMDARIQSGRRIYPEDTE